MKKLFFTLFFLLSIYNPTQCGKNWYEIKFIDKNFTATYFYYTDDIFNASMKHIAILTELLQEARKNNNTTQAENIKKARNKISQVHNKKLLNMLSEYKD